MPTEAPNAVPGLESKDEATKITKTHEEDKIDPLKVITNMEMVNEPQTISLAAALTTQDGSAETGNPTVHSASRTTEDLNKEAKTNGKNHLTKGKHKIPKTNNNYNVGFMDVKETVKNNDINVKEKNQVPSVLTPADPLASEVPQQ